MAALGWAMPTTALAEALQHNALAFEPSELRFSRELVNHEPVLPMACPNLGNCCMHESVFISQSQRCYGTDT